MKEREKMTEKVNVYLGGPLFSEADQLFNEQLAARIRERFGEQISLYSPQENEAINDKSGYANSIDIFEGDNEYLDRTDILIAHLDGPVIDPGLAAEIGYFYHSGRPILGLYSDSRQGHYHNQDKIDALEEVAESQFSYINLYVVGAVKKRGQIFKSSEELMEALAEILEEE